jgi:tetratricopeptide (TPR) repeat protein
MSELPRPPANPEALLEQLTEMLRSEATIDPQALEALARWRLGCGDGRGAARWQRWSRQPPSRHDLRATLHELLLRLSQHELAERLGGAEGWPAVLQTLAQHKHEQALSLQRQLIATATPINVALSRQLASLWQQQGQPAASLELLEGMARQAPSAPLCNAIAHLLEQQRQPERAAPWWDRSLQLQTQQPLVLMQRSRNALALGDAPLAFQLAQALLELDPGHAVGLELRVEALERLGARGSLRLALAPLVRQGRERYRLLACQQARWWPPRRRRQHSWRLAYGAVEIGPQPVALAPPRPIPPELLAGCRRVGLVASRDGLELAGALREAAPEGIVWDLASREPLRSQRNLQRLLPKGWQLRPWPRQAPPSQESLDALILAGPPTPEPGSGPCLRWQASRRRWERWP